jgi:hypothetical protein
VTIRHAKHRPRRRMVLAPIPSEDDVLVEAETRQIERVMRQANTTQRWPARFLDMEQDPRLADVWFRRMGVVAAGVQLRAMMRAMNKYASVGDVNNGVTAARDVQNRLYGKPIERMAIAGRVKVEFGGLNPDAFPKEPREAQSEIVDIPGDTGTENEAEG